AVASRPEDRVAWEDYLSPRNAGEVNVNTAPLEVLMSLADKLDRRLVEDIAARRARTPFKREAEVKEVPGVSQELYNEIGDRLTVKSSRFVIRSRSELHGTASSVVAEVERSGSTTRL